MSTVLWPTHTCACTNCGTTWVAHIKYTATPRDMGVSNERCADVPFAVVPASSKVSPSSLHTRPRRVARGREGDGNKWRAGLSDGQPSEEHETTLFTPTTFVAHWTGSPGGRQARVQRSLDRGPHRYSRGPGEPPQDFPKAVILPSSPWAGVVRSAATTTGLSSQQTPDYRCSFAAALRQRPPVLGTRYSSNALARLLVGDKSQLQPPLICQVSVRRSTLARYGILWRTAASPRRYLANQAVSLASPVC